MLGSNARRRCGKCGAYHVHSSMFRVADRASNTGWLCHPCYNEVRMLYGGGIRMPTAKQSRTAKWISSKLQIPLPVPPNFDSYSEFISLYIDDAIWRDDARRTEAVQHEALSVDTAELGEFLSSLLGKEVV